MTVTERPSVIPWVAMWSSERDAVKSFAWTPIGLAGDFAFHAFGCGWINFGNSPTVGEPLFGQVHTTRQFRCMKGSRCQVCARKFEPGEPIPWLVPDAHSQFLPHLITQTPPVCERCLPVAKELCPFLRSNDVVELTVKRHRVFGVVGDYYPTRSRAVQGVLLRIDEHTKLPFLLGRQLVVELLEYEVTRD